MACKQQAQNVLTVQLRSFFFSLEPYHDASRGSIDKEPDRNERFEGYAIDLVKELSQLLGFNYELSWPMMDCSVAARLNQTDVGPA